MGSKEARSNVLGPLSSDLELKDELLLLMCASEKELFLPVGALDFIPAPALILLYVRLLSNFNPTGIIACTVVDVHHEKDRLSR